MHKCGQESEEYVGNYFEVEGHWWGGGVGGGEQLEDGQVQFHTYVLALLYIIARQSSYACTYIGSKSADQLAVW